MRFLHLALSGVDKWCNGVWVLAGNWLFGLIQHGDRSVVIGDGVRSTADAVRSIG